MNMLRKLFSAGADDSENSVLGKLFMGLMLGAAVGWVLLKRFQRPAVTSYEHPEGIGNKKEIEITTAVLSEPEIEPESQAPSNAEPVTARDRLEAIKGIGPVFARRLNEAGILSYADLAATPPEKLREIVAAKSWQAVEPGEWINQARLLGSAA